MAHPHHDSSETDGEPRSKPAQAIPCPLCGGIMAGVTMHGVTIDRCGTCGGMWLDALEKERLIARGDAGAVDTADSGTAGAETDPRTPRRLLCPRDRSTLIQMTDLRQPHIRYESCTVCGGLFLDAGELKDLSERTVGERLRSMMG